MKWNEITLGQVGSSGIVCLTESHAQILYDKAAAMFAQGWASDGAAGQVLQWSHMTCHLDLA